MTVKNRPCPECREAGHDKTGDHLFLSEDKKSWICSRIQHHAGRQYFVLPNDPETNEPIVEPRETTKKPVEEPNKTNTGLSRHSQESMFQPVEKLEIADLPAVDFRGIPEGIRERYGCHHELSEADRSVVAVYYPIYEDGARSKWKKRVVKTKKFVVVEE